MQPPSPSRELPNSFRAWLGAITALLGAVIAVAQLIPGDEPEATLQRVVDFIAQFSRK